MKGLRLASTWAVTTMSCLLASQFIVACGGSGSGSGPLGTGCTYPAGAPTEFVVNDRVPAFSWPTALSAAGGMQALSLEGVACDTDPVRAWSGTDYLLFVSFPEWGPVSLHHVNSVAGVEDDLVAEGLEIFWVLEQNGVFAPGTASDCRARLDSLGSTQGLCLGDGETQPTPGAFDDSALAIGRGFDILVRRSDMRIVYETTHGAPQGNENLTGPELLVDIRAVIAP